MHKGFILLLGMVLGSHVSAAAQTSAPLIVLAQEHIAPVMTMLRRVSTPLPAASFVLSQEPRESNAHFSLLFAGAYERDRSLERLPPMVEVKSLIFTLSSLPLVQFWAGRFQLDAFQSTLRLQNVQFGPLGNSGMQDFHRPQQSYPDGPRSVHLPGLSLSFHFGRDSRTRRPTQVWRRMTRLVGAVLN
jgi:hypothetical protein